MYEVKVTLVGEKYYAGQHISFEIDSKAYKVNLKDDKQNKWFKVRKL